MNTLRLAAIVTLGVVSLQAQQQFDDSGDSLLKGAYQFRHVAIVNTDSNGDPIEVAAVFGTITFDGAGNYSITGTYVDNASSSNGIFGTSGKQTPVSVQGSYAIGTNGYGYLANPFYPTDGSEVLWGAVAQGVFVGSDTESGFNSNASLGAGFQNDVFIAIPAGAPGNGGFTAPYWVGLLDFTAGISRAEKNAMFKLSPNGAGGFGTLTVNGFANNQGGTNLSQTVTGASYNFDSSGNANLNIPLPSGVSSVNALFTGGKTMYVSADGKFVLGWSPNGYDIFFGVRAQSVPANSSFAGTYFFAGLEDFPGSGADDYYGSIVANGIGDQTMDQRVDFYSFAAEDYVCSGMVQFNLDGTGGILVPPCPTFQYAFSDNGQALVGIGEAGDYALIVGLHGTPQPCSGLCINSTAIYNSASYAPLTAPIAPGELITLYVSGLPAVEQVCIGGQPCNTQLGGVQVLINNILAPIFSVSGSNGTVSVLVPYEITPASFTANIRVNSGGTLSNSVTVPFADALPGFFTYSQNGLGPAIAEHANGQFVTSSNPAMPGETIVLVLSGPGAVTPGINDGAVPSTTTLSYSNLFNSSVNCATVFQSSTLPSAPFLCANFNDYTNGVTKSVTPAFVGLAPGFAAEYQMNVAVPAGVGPGNVNLELFDPYYDQYLVGGFVLNGFDVNQVTIPVGSSGNAARPLVPQAPRRGGAQRPQRRPGGVRR